MYIYVFPSCTPHEGMACTVCHPLILLNMITLFYFKR